MPGISQVWLTAEELEAIAVLYDASDITAKAQPDNTPRLRAALAHPRQKEARAKIEAALAPVACDIASGPRTP